MYVCVRVYMKVKQDYERGRRHRQHKTRRMDYLWGMGTSKRGVEEGTQAGSGGGTKEQS